MLLRSIIERLITSEQPLGLVSYFETVGKPYRCYRLMSERYLANLEELARWEPPK